MESKADLPAAASVLLATRSINHWLGTHLTPEEIADMDPMITLLAGALARGMDPKKVDS